MRRARTKLPAKLPKKAKQPNKLHKITETTRIGVREYPDLSHK